jgi:hypothetical protein
MHPTRVRAPCCRLHSGHASHAALGGPPCGRADPEGGPGGWHYPCSPTGGSSADLDAAAPYLNAARELAGFESELGPGLNSSLQPSSSGGGARSSGGARSGGGAGSGGGAAAAAAAKVAAVVAAAAAAGEKAAEQLAAVAGETGEAAGAAAAGGDAGAGRAGVYKCAAVYPSADISMRLGRKNLHLFR